MLRFRRFESGDRGLGRSDALGDLGLSERPIPMKKSLRLAIPRIYARRNIALKSCLTILHCLANEYLWNF
jgi:hypothetical protein